MLFAGEWTHRQIHRQIFNQYSGISSHSFGCSYDKDTGGNSNGGGKKKQSTKSSGCNSDGNGDDDSNNNDNENEGEGVVDGSAASAVAAGWRQGKRGGGGQRDQYIPNWNCLLFN